LEARVAADLGRKWTYEPFPITYTVTREYVVDFSYKDVVLEVKGFFRPGDSTKYTAVAKACAEQGYRFVMMFANPYKQVRKDAKTTYATWANKRGITWFGTDEVSLLKAYLEKGYQTDE